MKKIFCIVLLLVSTKAFTLQTFPFKEIEYEQNILNKRMHLLNQDLSTLHQQLEIQNIQLIPKKRLLKQLQAQAAPMASAIKIYENVKMPEIKRTEHVYMQSLNGISDNLSDAQSKINGLTQRITEIEMKIPNNSSLNTYALKAEKKSLEKALEKANKLKEDADSYVLHYKEQLDHVTRDKKSYEDLNKQYQQLFAQIHVVSKEIGNSKQKLNEIKVKMHNLVGIIEALDIQSHLLENRKHALQGKLGAPE
jgi:chromosome segregation ATPase